MTHCTRQNLVEWRFWHEKWRKGHCPVHIMKFTLAGIGLRDVNMKASDAWKAVSNVFVPLFATRLARSIYRSRPKIKVQAFGFREAAYRTRTKAIADETPRIRRAGAAWRNNLENLPCSLILTLVYVLPGRRPAGAALCFASFALFRHMYTAACLRGLQPLRFVNCTGSVLVSSILFGHVIYRAFAN